MDRRQRSLINFLMNWLEGTFSLCSIDTFDHEKTVDYLVKLFENTITHVGKENEVQVCTDNATNYVLAEKKLMVRNKVFWTHCTIHHIDICLRTLANMVSRKLL